MITKMESSSGMDQLFSVVESAIAERRGVLHRLSEEIWLKPELKFAEHEAHDCLVRFFQEENFTNVEPKYLLPTAFRVVEESKGFDAEKHATVAVCCEYDALPGIGLCGRTSGVLTRFPDNLK